VANPPGILTISGSTLSFLTTDGSMAVNATFTTSSTKESCSGGGKGGHVTCSFTFTGMFSGTLTVNGSTQAINGSTYQVYGTNGAVGGGITGYNSSYTPLYFTDGNARILRSDDLSGTNAIAYGTQGTDVGQFYGPSGIALDSAGRIYITDTYNDRIVRIDDMNGTNWTSLGTYGNGIGQFVTPQSISIDPAGHIWVLDNGNGRLIRMDDMNGTNWTVVGSVGSGVGQFAALSSAPGFDALGRIYWADAANRWIARFDDLNFTNWTTLSQSQPIGPYIYQFGSITGVVVDAAGKIYVADGTSVVRVDDMTGANWSSISVGTFAPHTIAVDSSGMVVLGNGYNAQIVDSEATVLTSNINGLVQGVYVSVYGAVPLSLPSPRPSAISFTPPALSFTQNVGTSATLPVTITNFGGSPLSLSGIVASGGFTETDNCSSQLFPGSNCTANVTFAPSATGAANGTLTINDNSGNAGAVQTVTLSGTGTAPVASVSPASLSFSSQVQGASSTAKTVTVLNSGTGPMQVSSVTASAPFSQTNTCSASLAPGASCTISVTFTPTAIGSFTGSLTIVDDAGTQTVALSGSGTAQVTLSASSLSLGTMVVGNTSAAKTVTLTNHAKVSFTFTSIVTSANFGVASNTCGSSVAAGASCSVGVTFTPLAAGAATGSLTFTDSALNSPQIVNLTGTGTAAGASVTVSPSSLQFPQQPTGTTSAGMLVTVTNTGTTAITNNGATITGDFADTTTCTSSLSAGKSCSVTVTFTPTAAGTRTGTLTINLSTGAQVVSLSGTSATSSQLGALSLSATTLTFSGYTIGDNPSKSVTVKNTGGSSVGIGSVIIAGDPSLTQKTTCGSALAASATCTITVTFKPVAYGTFTGTVTLTEGSGAQHTVAVTGVSAADN
jgi:sugar lactone lactonase YvrE